MTLIKMNDIVNKLDAASKRITLPPVLTIETEEQAAEMRSKSNINWKIGDKYCMTKRHCQFKELS